MQRVNYKCPFNTLLLEFLLLCNLNLVFFCMSQANPSLLIPLKMMKARRGEMYFTFRKKQPFSGVEGHCE